MGFPKEVAERALVDCGRHCSLCHKFCGIKIELHHIVQVSEGGPNTFENCIPVCFDCHAEVKAYNPKHPKGRSFSVTELAAHRDRWYERVKSGGGSTAQVSYRTLDMRTYEKVQELLPQSGTIAFLRENNFAGFSFRMSAFDDLDGFLRYSEINPDFEFIDPDLEAIRVDLFTVGRECRYTVAMNTWTTKSPGMATVPPEWEESDPDRFNAVVEKIHELTTRICDRYDDLVRLARRKLLFD